MPPAAYADFRRYHTGHTARVTPRYAAAAALARHYDAFAYHMRFSAADDATRRATPPPAMKLPRYAIATADFAIAPFLCHDAAMRNMLSASAACAAPAC